MNNLKKKATLSILLMVSMGHLLNDMFQSVIPSIYPIIKESLGLSFMQIGAITLTNQITAPLPAVFCSSCCLWPLSGSALRCFIPNHQR